MFLCFYTVIPTYSAQLATKFLFKFKPNFKHIFLLELTSLLVSAFVNVIFNFATSTSSQFKQDSVFLPIVTSLLIRFILFAKFIKQPESGAIGQSKAFKIVVLSIMIEILLALPIGFILMLLFNVMH